MRNLTHSSGKDLKMNMKNEYVTNSPLQRQFSSNGTDGSRNGFVEFEMTENEQSIPSRFEKIVNQFPNQIAIKTTTECMTFDQLNKSANRIGRTILQQKEGKGLIGTLIEQGPAFLAWVSRTTTFLRCQEGI
jgi:hypothetical protein